jgi:putative flippase GtrA
LKTLTRQVSRFAIVGGVATGLHFVTALVSESYLMLHPAWANTVGFLSAVTWSLVLNWAWTFDGQTAFRRAAPRFLLLAIVCFAVGQVIIMVAAGALHWPMWLALLPVVTLVPLLSFVGSKLHVFR